MNSIWSPHVFRPAPRSVLATLAVFLLISCVFPTQEVPSTASGPAANGLWTSRAFAGPAQLPADAWGGYTMVVFTSNSRRNMFERNLMVCEHFLAAMEQRDWNARQGVPKQEQVLTVWPVDDGETADALNVGRQDEPCEVAVESYDLDRAKAVIDDVQKTIENGFSGRGPYLVTWIPGLTKTSQVSVAGTRAEPRVFDLSPYDTDESLSNIFPAWVNEVENPDDPFKRRLDPEKISFLRNMGLARFGTYMNDILAEVHQSHS